MVTDNVMHAGVYVLTMGIVGCLPDNVQRVKPFFFSVFNFNSTWYICGLGVADWSQKWLLS